MISLKKQFQVAWQNLLVILRNNYSLESWVMAPNDKAIKNKMITAATKQIEKERALEREPLLFKEDTNA